eukprot:UN02596
MTKEDDFSEFRKEVLEEFEDIDIEEKDRFDMEKTPFSIEHIFSPILFELLGCDDGGYYIMPFGFKGSQNKASIKYVLITFLNVIGAIFIDDREMKPSYIKMCEYLTQPYNVDLTSEINT